MATPSAHKPMHHQAMTPGSSSNYLTSLSPMPAPPRSVGQSPAYLAKKSPANATSTMQAHGLGRSQSNGPLIYDSPTAAALVLNLNDTSLETGVGVGVRAEDDRRKRRIQTILATLRDRPGRVSEEGLERLARRTELEWLWEDGSEGARALSLAGSGLVLEVEFRDHVFARVTVTFPASSKTVSALAPLAAKVLERDLRGAGGGGGRSLSFNKSLAPFGTHLERLVTLDRLSSAPLNCYDAIAGIHTSLERIFEWEKRKLKGSLALQEASSEHREEMLEREVLCTGSGRPRMHAGRRLGLSLEYWMQQKAVRPFSDVETTGEDDMEVDDDDEDEEEEEQSKTWAAIIECEPSPAELFTSVRMSHDWVSEKVERPAGEGEVLLGSSGSSTIDWLEPPPTMLPGVPGDTGQDINGVQGKLPDVRFVATLDPPVVVPLRVAYEIYNMVGFQVPHEATTYDGLLLERLGVEGTAVGAQAADGRIPKASVDRKVTVFDEEGHPQCARRYRSHLYVPRQDYGRVIETIPFAHPRQLVAILPILRQHALLADIISNAFAGPGRSKAPAFTDGAAATRTGVDAQVHLQATEARLASLLSDAPRRPLQDDRGRVAPNSKPGARLGARSPSLCTVDITLSTQAPVPQLGIIFPHRGHGRLRQAIFDIDLDGRMRISEQDIVHSSINGDLAGNEINGEAEQKFSDREEDKGESGKAGQDDERTQSDKGPSKRGSRSATVEELRRAMEVAEDIGIWIEFVSAQSP